jgi:hypothetical protein
MVPGTNSKHFDFFVTYEWAQEATVFVPGRPLHAYQFHFISYGENNVL